MERMEKFKAKMMGHFPSVRVGYQEPRSFFSQLWPFPGGPISHCASVCRCGLCEVPAHGRHLPGEPQRGGQGLGGIPNFPLFPQERQEKALPWNVLDVHPQLLPLVLQPLTPDLGFRLAGVWYPLRQRCEGGPSCLKASLSGVVWGKNGLRPPSDSYITRHAFSSRSPMKA